MLLLAKSPKYKVAGQLVLHAVAYYFAVFFNYWLHPFKFTCMVLLMTHGTLNC